MRENDSHDWIEQTKPISRRRESCSKRIFEENYTFLLSRRINIETWIRLLHCSFFINQIEIFVVHASESYWSETFTCVHRERFLHENWKISSQSSRGISASIRERMLPWRRFLCDFFFTHSTKMNPNIRENTPRTSTKLRMGAEPSKICVFWIFMLVFVVHFKIITSKHVYWFWISSWMGFG